jgi:DNA invertase Pin-like site-specific DNA recombinase
MKIGYARVSKDEQDLAPQLHALDAAGCGTVFQDQGWSGASAARFGCWRLWKGQGKAIR